MHPVPGASAKIPILEDVDGTTLIESWTIMHYLEYKYPETPLLPKGAAERAKVCSSLWAPYLADNTCASTPYHFSTQLYNFNQASRQQNSL